MGHPARVCDLTRLRGSSNRLQQLQARPGWTIAGDTCARTTARHHGSNPLLPFAQKWPGDFWRSNQNPTTDHRL